MSTAAMLSFAMFAIAVILVAAFANWLVGSAPFMDGGLKSIVGWAIWALAGVILVSRLLGFA